MLLFRPAFDTVGSHIRIVGITGGAGSGKSTLARMMTVYGITHIDADQVARQATAPGSEGLEKIIRQFGPTVLDATGALNRQHLRELVFRDSDARVRLEKILHPIITRMVVELLDTTPGPIVYEAALLLEAGHDRLVDMVVTVSAPTEIRLRRLLQRPGMDENKARAMIAAQNTDMWREERSHAVVHNTGDLESLRIDTEKLVSLFSC